MPKKYPNYPKNGVFCVNFIIGPPFLIYIYLKGFSMNKKELSERDIVTKFILPGIIKSGWTMDVQVREEVSFTDIIQLKTPIATRETTTK